MRLNIDKCTQALALCFGVFALAGAASAQVNLTAPAAPVLVGSNISMAGTGYPTGTITPSAVSIKVTPSAGNGSPVSFAPSTVTGAGSNRSLIFKLPPSLSANLPYTATVCVSGQTTSNVAFTTNTCATITINPAGSISNVSPGAGQQGTAVNVTITGLYTHFGQATSVVSVGGTGVTPSGMVVSSTTKLTATFTIAPNATIGVYPVTVTTGSEVATLPVGFVVTSTPGLSFSLINPDAAPQGASLSVDVQGLNTQFVQGVTTANFGDGITVTSILVNSPTDLTVGLTIDPLAPPGGRMVTVVTGGQFAVAENGFTVTSSGASIISAAPNTPLPQGSNATLTLTGLGTHWVTSGTTVSFGGGINTGSIIVNSNTSLTVNISVGPGVAPGVYGATTTTNGEVASLGSAVTVSASTPFISGVTPTTGAQGANSIDVIVTGTFTNFLAGALSANFGSLITVNSVHALSATSVDINISIAFVAATGGRSVTLTSNGTLFSFNFTVTPDGASVTGVTPNSGLQQSSVALQVTGSNTHWFQGTTVASLGDSNITINRVIVNSPTTAEVDITLGAQAGLGLHGISMTTGGEVASASNVFTVLPFTPSLSLAPSSGMIGTVVTVNFNGNFTHFSNQTEVNIDGEGIQISGFTPLGPTTATAKFTISQTAPASPALLCAPGNRDVTLTTGDEIVTAPFCVTSTPAVLTSITPSHSPQNNNLTVTITGQFTSFTSTAALPANNTTVGFGPDITPGGLVINSATSLTVNIAIDPVAALGWRQAFVNTGTEQLSIGFLIDAPASASLVSVTPSAGQQGQTLTGVTITGNLTNFSANTIAILGAGITVSNLQILSPSVATATIAISPTTAVGARTVEMITGAEDVTGPLFSVNPGIAAITFTPNCNPTGNQILIAAQCTSPTLATVQQGGIVPFNITGTNTNFLQGETTMNFDGSDIAVTQLTVNSPTSITGQIAVSYTAAIGFRFATATTDGEVAKTSTDALNVIQTTSTSLNITPTSGQQGTQHLMIQMNGSLTNWVNGNTVASFGNNNGLTVNSVNVTSPTQAVIDLTIQGTADVGLYSLTVTTNNGGNPEQESLTNVFSVGPGAAIITKVVPSGNSSQGSSESIVITGQNTSWINGVTAAYFTEGGCVGSPNPGVNVANVVVGSMTSATLSIAIAPNAQTGLQTLCMTTLGESVNFQNAFTITSGTPTLNGVTPVNAEQGSTATLAIIGQFTNWQQGVTTITFGEGITLTSPLTVTSATTATVNIAIDPLADIGTRDVVLNTNGRIVQGTAFFSVIAGPAILSSISPTTGNQGTHILMQVNGEGTHWAQGLSQVTINGAGYDITINGVQVQSPTTLVIDMNLSPTANLGLRTIYVSTGGENVTLQNGFVVTGGIPSISGILPSSAQQGSNAVNVQISGIFTLWDNTTQVSFGPNITFGTPQWTVNSNTSITAVINIPNGAPLGLQTVTVQTAGQILTTSFNILSNAPPTPYISYEYPSVALVGQTLSVNLAGQYTHWLPGSTQITFGAGITVNNFQVTGENSAIANITIIPTATLGTRTVTMTTGAEVENTNFTVTVGTPAITMLSPNSIIQGQTLDVDVIGQYTTFSNSTIFSFGQGIAINTVTLFGPTAARLNITADIEANLGGRSVSETTGAEVAYNQVGFSVTPSQATITMVTPNTAPQGTTPTINVTGFATHWVQNSTIFSLGGIGITNVTVTSPTTATLTLSIATLAGLGEYSITASTNGEDAFENNAFVVTPGTPVLLSATGATVQQGQDFTFLTILGRLTSFVPGWPAAGATSVNLGNGVTVTGVNVTSPTSITVTGTADPLAYTGGRNVTVTTGAQQLVLFGAFSVTPGTAEISQLSPATGNQGQTFNVTITGTNTNFTQNVSIANFGQGVVVNTLTVNSLTSATASITVAANAFAQQNTVTMTTLGETAFAVNAFTVVSTTPIIDFIDPTFLSQGQAGTISITSSFTSFINGNTQASFGAGVNVISTTVTGPGAATADISVSPTAVAGKRTVQMTTNLGGGNQQVAILSNAFTINPGSATITSATPTTPATIHQGDTDDTIVVVGSGTHFDATSLVAFCNGITPVQINLNSATQLTVIVNVAATTTIGACGATVTTGGEIATGASLFNVLAGLPVVTSLNPISAAQNAQNLNVTVSGLFTHFVQGATTASFGSPAITVNTVTVSGSTFATVNISVSQTATIGNYTITMSTGAEHAPGTNLFAVTAGAPQLTSINPTTGAQNSVQTVTVNGLFTNFVQGTSVVTFNGENVTAGVATVNGPTQLTVSVTVAPGAAATARTITVTTGAEVDSLSNAFTVLPGAPTITTISPNVGVPNTPSLQVTITGLFTNWVNGTTTATFGPDISVGGAALGAYGPVNVTSPTTAVATISIDNTVVPPTAREVIVNGPPSIVVNNGFTIQSNTPTAPTIISVSPTSGATGVPLNSSYTVVFSSPINPATVAAGNSYLVPTQFSCNPADAVPAVQNVDASGRILTLTPSAVLAVGQAYYFCINVNSAPFIKDPSGNTISGTDYSFTTGFTTSSTGPTFLSANIINNDTNVGTNVTPTMGFDKAIDPATQLAGLTIFQGATPVAGTWSYNATFTQAIFTPAGGFTANTLYTLNLTNALTDTVGNDLVNPTVISFTTGAGADNTAVTLISATPITGSITGESPTLRLVFSKEMNPLTVTLPGQYYLVNNVTNQTVLGTVVTASADHKTFTMTLPGPLSPSTQYYWDCGSLRDQSGHSISPGGDTFTTGTAVDLTAPVVTQVSPPNTETGVPVNAPVEILLSKQIDPTTVSSASLTLSPAVAGAVALSANGLTMTFTPGAVLATSQVYTVNVSGFADLNGNLVTPFSSSFTTSASATPDTTHGSITMLPTSGTTNVATNTSVVFTFTKIYDPATVSYGGNVRLYDSTVGTYIAGTITLNAALTTVTFTPSAPLEPNHQYCGYGGYPFTALISDLAGNTFSSFVNDICFQTANTADTTPPTVISVIPLNNATGIGPNNPVIVTFSKSMNPSTLTSSNLAIYEGTTVYTRSFNVSFDGTMAVFNAGNLPYNTTFTVVVTPNVADLAGNQLAAQFTSTFTTIPQPTTTVPTVTAIHPTAGATGVPVNAAITFFISEPLNTATVPGALNVSQNGVLITGNITYGSNNQVVTFTPSTNFLKGANIEAFFTPAATDNSGNPLTNYQANFTVTPNLSATPATLISTIPSEDVSGANAAPTTTVVELKFSKPINTATVNAGSFYIEQQDTTPVTGSYTFLNNNTVVRFTPSAPLAGTPTGNNTYYRVHYENTILDTDGLAISGSADNNWYFYVNTVSNTTSPTVTMLAPTNNAVGIGTNSTVRVTFSEQIDPLTITPSTLTLVSNATQIPYNASFDNLGTTLTIVPQAAFPASSVVTVGLTAGITDSSGNLLIPDNPSFTTAPAPDFVRPTVISSTVSEGQTNVPVTSIFTLTFSKPIDTRTEVVNSTVYLYDNVTAYVPINLSFSPDGTQVTLQPLSPLAVNRSMYVYTCSVQDLDGNTMNACLERDFTTALTAPVGGPQVTFILPPTGFQVPTNFLPAVQFNEPIDLTSLGGITLKQSGTPVAFTVAGSAGSTILALTPTSLLAPNLPYTLTITSVKDTGGNTMVGNATSNFTTGPSIDLVAPVVTSITPQNGETTGTNPVLRITLSEPINPLKSNPNWNLYNNVTGVRFPGAAIAASADLKTETVTYPGNLDPNTQYCWSAGQVYDLAANNVNTPTPCFTTSSGPVSAAPTVTSVTPPNGQAGVPINALIQITLSSPIDATSVNSSSLTLTPAAPAGSSVSLSSDGFTMTLGLGASTLSSNTSYSLNAGGFRDVNGNTVTAFSSSFTTSAFDDTLHGTISLNTPAPGSTGVSTTSTIQVTLSQLVDPNSVIANTFEVYANNNGNQRIPGAISIGTSGSGGSTLTFTPIGPMPPLTPISIYVGDTASLLDLAGNTFTALNNAIFTTASTPDSTPPTVISFTPTNGATKVGPNAVVTLIFSKALNYSTVNAQNFTLFNGFTNLGATVSVSSDNRTVTLTTTLPYSATLTVAVNTSVQDLDGNNLANPFSSTFTTETQPLTAVPTVTVMRPANGATGVLINDTITLYFSAPMNAATVPGAFYVEQKGTLLTGAVVVNADGRSAVWTGPGFLNSAYIQVFFTGAMDTSGNTVTSYSASFTAAPSLSATAATLSSTVPSEDVSGANAAPTTTVVDLQFSKQIDPATVNSGSFYLLQNDATPVNGTITMLNNNTVLRFIPSAPFSGTPSGNNTFYRVHYENTLKDIDGLPISGSADNTWYFYVNTATNTTTPTVTSFAPYNGATGVGDNATIRLTFNEVMDTLTIDPATVTLMNGATSIPFSITFGGSSFTTMTLSPYAPLPVNATLTLALTGGITDTSNNALAPQSISFQTGPGADFSKPFVIYSSVNSSTPTVPVNSTFTVVFNKPLDRNTVNTACTDYSLYNNNLGCTVGSTVTISPDGTTITYVPTAPLPPSANLEVYAEGATDLDGNTQTNFAVNFFTNTATVTTPPTVLTSNPANGAAGAPLNSSIEAQFSAAVSGASLSQVTLMNGGTPVPFTASLIYADSVVRLTPASLLLPGTTYTVSFTGVQDDAGNTMTGTYSFSFTTGTNVDENATPNVVSTIANGLPLTNNVDVTNVPDNPTFTITLDTPVEPGSLSNGGLVLYLNSNTNITYPLNIGLSADQKTITVTLAPGTLAANTEYQFRVGSSFRIRDWAGSFNNSQSYSYLFTTQ
ncbi:MAG TPA: Ig-like domain-containing protein [Bryobacteraceae bacterium]|nr:Ig-like domain-containing protein [Bryobacteraceae bacterium]